MTPCTSMDSGPHHRQAGTGTSWKPCQYRVSIGMSGPSCRRPWVGLRTCVLVSLLVMHSAVMATTVPTEVVETLQRRQANLLPEDLLVMDPVDLALLKEVTLVASNGVPHHHHITGFVLQNRILTLATVPGEHIVIEDCPMVRVTWRMMGVWTKRRGAVTEGGKRQVSDRRGLCIGASSGLPPNWPLQINSACNHKGWIVSGNCSCLTGYDPATNCTTCVPVAKTTTTTTTMVTTCTVCSGRGEFVEGVCNCHFPWTGVQCGLDRITRSTTNPTPGAGSVSPTTGPTTNPTTLAPTTLATTTLVPTTAPTTLAPTTAPTTLAPTTAPTTSPTTSPTTLAPILAPTTSPTTLAPTTAPTTSPTTSPTLLWCAPGSFFVGYPVGVCFPCVEGKFMSVLNRDDACSDCESGQVARSSGATDCDKCLAGTAPNTASSDCDDCVAGKYAELSGMASCVDCDSGKVSWGVARTTCSNCAAGAVPKATQTGCTACGRGRFAAEVGLSACSNCIAGQVTEGNTGSTACVNCAAGQAPDTQWSTCVGCVQGKFASQGGLAACSNCTAGQVTGVFGGFTGATACFNCTAGTAPDATLSVCDDCVPGKFASQDGLAACLDCDPGQVAESIGAVACTDCSAGRFSVSDLNACSECGVGRYARVAGMSVCTACRTGRYNNLTGQTVCIACSIGHQQHNQAATVCGQCSRGHFMNETGADKCDACYTGTYMDQAGATVCNECGTANARAFETCPSEK